MQKISLETALEKLADIAQNSLFYYNDYAYRFDVVRLSPDDVSKIVFDERASTQNVLGVIQEQKKWFSTKENFKEYINKQDLVFRWTAVNNRYPILCLDVRTKSDSLMDAAINDRYMLINWDGVEFIGLRTKVNYTPNYE